MTTYQKPQTEPPRKDRLALWAGLTTLFTNLAAINIVVWFGDESDPRVNAIAAFITSLTVAASVFAKQHWDDEKRIRQERD